MSTKQQLTIAVATVVLIAGATGVGAAVPGAAQTGDATDDTSPGPEGGLPGPVPDFVSGILDSIGSFLDGDSDQPESTPSDSPGSNGGPDVAQSQNSA